jgi:thioredoxin-like negative regulator of GroEL
MDKKRIGIVVIAVAVIAALAVGIWYFGVYRATRNIVEGNQPQTTDQQDAGNSGSDDGAKKGNTSDNTKSTTTPKSGSDSTKNQTNAPTRKPTFMYFVSGSDEKAAETSQIIDSLKAKYGDKVEFDIRNIDENPDDAKNFSIAQTPTLYLLDGNGDFKDMKFGFSDQAALEESIGKVLN